METIDQPKPAPQPVDQMQSEAASTNGDILADVNPTPPEEELPGDASVAKPVETSIAAPSPVPDTSATPPPVSSEPTENVESGISGVAAFLPPEANLDQPTPSPSEPLATTVSGTQDASMPDAPEPAASVTTQASQDLAANEPVQQHTPAPEATDPAINDVSVKDESVSEQAPVVSGETLVKDEMQTSLQSSAPSLPNSSQPTDIVTESAIDNSTKPEPEDTQMSESTSSLTRSRDEADDTEERSAKRARLEEPAIEEPASEASAQQPAAEDFKKPDVPSSSVPAPDASSQSETIAPSATSSQATSQGAAPSAPTPNGTSTNNLPSRKTYTSESITPLQKKQLEEKIKNTKKVKSATPFLRPVDYMALNIPNYPNIIKQPMDLSTMEHKLKNNQYTSLEAFVSDFELMVNNCFTFNGPAHVVSVQAQNLRAYFLKQMDSVPVGDAASSAPKSKKHSPVPKPQPRRESRTAIVPTVTAAAAPAAVAPPAAPQSSARSPSASDTFALLPGGTPQIRRDSTAGRPKRAVVPPPSRDLPYSGSKPKRKENQVGLKFCQFVLDELRKPRYDHMTIYFREPVDPVALNIPHYYQIIKRPMDMQTITNKLKNGQYGSAEDFKTDFDLIFTNCFKFNPPENGVHQTGKTLQAEFESLWTQKNGWVKRHQPRSQRVTPASDESDAQESSEEEEDAEEDEKEATIQALKEQLASMQNMLGQISGAAKRDSPKASGKKKGRNSAGVTKSKKSSVSAPVAKPAAKSKTSKKPRLVTYEEKQEISNATENMNEAQINKLTAIITENVSKYKDMAGDDVELEIDDLPNEVQLKLLKYVRTIFPKAKPTYIDDEDMGVDDDYEPERATKSGGGRKKHKPMKKREQEERIAQLNAKIEGMKKGSNGQSAPAEPQEESSGDEDSESSEEE
ncbi:hypothetical protein CAC42_4906 [Sphaceloma murrayae]|uniref:Bromodomain-containing protein n=1 Tax=Sphaceloma murrayae TaxID=2082308 RepID=A0A2K1QPK5_9PEZI|nr:hypothetical protein CAC42_4906 [Sphaceloma murrayae]